MPKSDIKSIAGRDEGPESGTTTWRKAYRACCHLCRYGHSPKPSELSSSHLLPTPGFDHLHFPPVPVERTFGLFHSLPWKVKGQSCKASTATGAIGSRSLTRAIKSQSPSYSDRFKSKYNYIWGNGGENMASVTLNLKKIQSSVNIK